MLLPTTLFENRRDVLLKDLYSRFASDEVDTSDVSFVQDFVQNYCKREGVSEIDVKLLTQAAFRVCMDKILVEKPALVGALVDVAIQSVLAGVADPTTPLLILEDALDLVAISECETVWDVMEQRRDTFMKAPFVTAKTTNSSLALLRIANGLLKRLSKSDDSEPVFCGRILMFLAYVFPFSERSGVNSAGYFNTANVTPFEAEGGAGGGSGASADSEAAAAPTDFGLYRTFWGVQEQLSNPSKIVASKDGWSSFLSSVNTVAAAFDGQGVAIEGDVEEGEESGEPPAAIAPISGESSTAGDIAELTPAVIEEFYGTKYLTNSQLFNLQLRDPTLRRHILIQFLIVIQLLLKGKKGLFGSSAIPITSSMTTELETLKQRVLSCLGQTPPDGIKCRDAIVHILNREVYWMRWKDAGCVAVEREPLSDIPTYVGGELAKSSKTAQPLHWASLGSSVDVMTALANPSNAASSARRTLEAHLVELQDALDLRVDDECNPALNKAYVWRGLRLLAADKLDLMASVSGERFDQLMAKEGRVKFPEPLAEDKVEDGDEALAAYMASQAAEAGAGSESVPEKKRPRKSAAAAPAPAPAEEGEEEGEDSTVKKSKPE